MTTATSAASATIDQLIITSPYEEPTEHWKYDRETRRFTREPGRRPAGYVRASEASKSFDDPGEFIELPLVNQIRPRVKAWREADYPGATGITKRLLKHWRDREQRESFRRFFFCQLEAIETLMWLAESPESERVGIKIPGDGGPFTRLCAKMATGSGKTILMSMLIAWQVLNKVTYPQDKRFSKNILVIAPGLTVRNRLEVLVPGSSGNYYAEFQIVPPGLEDKLRQGQSCRVLVRNWHKLDWESDEQIAKRRSVDKRGALSDEAYVREVLGEMATAENILVINDEAHHAWRVPPKVKIAGISKDELKEATKWVGGLDRIHSARGILMCYDMTATPFAPTGRKSGEETLFGWIVSDFGLNDAIESGLVKTPRVVVPIRSTSDMLPWYTGKACEHTKRSHINMCVYDSRWEANEAIELDRNNNVRAWVKNDHLNFEITYSFKGVIHKFRPDYLVKLTNGKMLILEVKGQDDQQQQTKRQFLAEWVTAVNTHGGFGMWAADVSRHPKDVLEILQRQNA